MPISPWITRAVKRSQGNKGNMAEPGEEQILGELDGQDGEDAESESPKRSPPSTAKSVRKSAKKKRETKTEKRFQRLEAMMTQIIQAQTARSTPAPTAERIPATLVPATPASLPPWRPDTVPAAYGLPRPMIPMPRLIQQDTPCPKQPLAAHLGFRADAPPPPPEALVDDPVAAGHIAEMIRHLEPVFQQTGGKRDSILKPHMFIPRRFANKKLADKEDISLFVNGMSGLILNSLRDQSTVAAALCRHLREAAKDMAKRPWAVAREWSKTIFDRIKRREIEWSHYNEIQRERLQSALSWSPPEKAIYPCALYNGKACQEPDSHTEEGVTYRHICAHCFYANSNIKPHPAKQCTGKKVPFTLRAASVPPATRMGRNRPQPEADPKN